MVGQRLAHYEIDEHLGSGGMDVVYRASHIKLSRSVALKFLRDDVAADSCRVSRFRREAKALAALFSSATVRSSRASAPPITLLLNWTP